MIFGCLRKDGANVFNSALILNREGELAGYYDKVHCRSFDLKCTPGVTLPVFDSDFGIFGVMICADRCWPETVRTLALKGARIIFNPTFGMHDDLNASIVRTRSFESDVWIAFTHPKQALVTGPLGKNLVNNRDEEDHFVISEVDLSFADQVRAREYHNVSFLNDRKPDAYEL